MSQRKGRKRRRESEDDSPERGSVLDVKRKRLEQVLDVLKSNKDGSQIEPEVQVRRSGRTPKAKVFDDDYVTEIVRASESPKMAASKSATSCPREEVVYMDDRKLKIKKEPVDLDKVHKRETRRSYQQYLEELGNQSNVTEGNAGYKNKPSKERDSRRKVKLELAEEEALNPVTEMYNQPALGQRDNTWEQRNTERKREKERTRKEAKQQLVLGSAGSLDDPGVSGQADIVLSPKVRASSRAPVPKRTFPLLQAPLHQTASERQQLSHEENKCSTITGVKVEVPEEVSKVSPQKVRSSTRTPVPKRSFSLLEDKGTYRVREEVKPDMEVQEDEPQGSQKCTPPEPMPAMSLPGTPVRKRPLTLLGSLKEKRKGDKIVPCSREDVSVEIGVESSSSKKRKKGYSPGIMLGQGESLPTPDGSQVDKAPKQQKRTLTKDHSGKVKKKKSVKEFGQVSGEVNSDVKRKTKRKQNKNDLPEVAVKQETVGDGSASGQGMYQTPKSQGKSLLLKESAKNSPSRSENSVSLADLALEISKSLTSLKPSDDAKRTDVTSKKAMPKVKSGQKVKHAAKKHAHNDKSPKKIRKNISEASSEVFEEEEHIILKLHLPHSSDHAGKSGSKKHKHRHASESQDGIRSPKKKHKKTTSKSSVDGTSGVKMEPDAMKKKKKKKISLKFKGLSSRHIGLEVEGTSSGDSNKVVKISAGHSGKAGDNSVASTSLEGSGKKKKKSTGENSPSTHSPPKTGHVSKDKERNKSRSKEKQVRKEKEQSRIAPGESTSTKSKEGSPSKKKESKKPKMVTSYLLFCKQERSKIVRENPGLEFSQISKKVGEAWNNLPEEDKQFWREKAYEANQKLRDVVECYSQKLLEPIDMAAHLRLLGESLLTIGVCLGQQDQMEVHGSLSVLLDSALCAMSPLLFLTSQVPELNGCPKAVQAAVLDNLGHIMPGLG